MEDRKLYDPITNEAIEPEHLMVLAYGTRKSCYNIVTLKRYLKNATCLYPRDPMTGNLLTQEQMESIRNHPIPIPPEILELEALQHKKRLQQEEKDIRAMQAEIDEQNTMKYLKMYGYSTEHTTENDEDEYDDDTECGDEYDSMEDQPAESIH